MLDHLSFRNRLTSAKGNVVHFGKPEPGRQTNCYQEIKYELFDFGLFLPKNAFIYLFRTGPRLIDVEIAFHPNCTKGPVPYNLTILKGYKVTLSSRTQWPRPSTTGSTTPAFPMSTSTPRWSPSKSCPRPKGQSHRLWRRT